MTCRHVRKIFTTSSQTQRLKDSGRHPTTVIITNMRCHFPVITSLLLASVASAGPLEAREPVPGLIDDILNGALSPIAQLIKDILAGTTSAIDDTISSKPTTCSVPLLKDKCCVCKCNSLSEMGRETVSDKTRVRCVC